MENLKPKIIFVVRNLSIGGINTVTSELVKEIQVQGLYDVIVVSLSREKQEYKGFSEVRTEFFSFPIDSVFGKLARALNYFFPFLGSWIFGSLSRALFVRFVSRLGNVEKVFLCGFGAYSNFNRFNDGRFVFVSHSLKSRIIFKKSNLLSKLNSIWLENILSDRMIAVSHGVKKDWKRVIGSAADNIEVINNPVNKERVERLAKVKVFKNIPEKYFLLCGRLSKEKNFESIIKTWADSGVSEQLVVVGDGPEYSNLKTIVERLGIRKNVHFMGFLDNPYPFICKATAVIINSFYEGLPTLAIEAQFLKTPLIIGECGGAAYDVVQEKYYSEIFSINDQTKLMKNIQRASNNIYPIFEVDYEKFDVASVVKRYLDI
ncbi:glycosyltransferase [Marinobacter sp. F4216]|uniref:glycosyltransferase n=1 Tax=Marinobacter sp. F4216 TaxID=2874281 RepID=UPI001CBDF905|nr:glycosyltransferase [Marinobacter sp. F4216]MBZ2168430.1 glycosyltransferase [Marinobacter sp. F4216]